ncbi:MAG: dinitrogenase iron-molybdenum cofactor biosynthesis protein [Deltaproteobacteria bacterium]|nr:dinitrogenase iron-molybdenum cofactor biosynthesis protein [Deltaproteobacteria bacterium]
MTTSRIAVVSTDVKTVNDHFGRAERFLIYDVDDKITFVEERLTEKYSIGDPNHDFDPQKFNRSANLLKDCSRIYVSRIGERPESELQKLGTEPVIYDGLIDRIPDYAAS